jgi:tyrosine-protein phosphatase YwqE
VAINNSIIDEKAFTAKQKTSLSKKFEKVVKMRDSQLIDKSLYHFPSTERN